MVRSKIVVALSILIAAAGVSWGYAQQRTTTAATLTALDYIEIQQLYASYTRAIDFGEADGHDYAMQFVPDGVFVVVLASTPASCQPPAGWHAAGRDAIQGSIPDKAAANACISTLAGSQELANMARDFHRRNRLTARHVNTNLLITPMPGGARGFVYLNQLTVAPKPPTWSGSGFYEDTLVKTVAGWRFKKRINTHDAVVVAP